MWIDQEKLLLVHSIDFRSLLNIILGKQSVVRLCLGTLRSCEFCLQI